MSFILDALRRSERARRALGDAPVDVPLAARRPPVRTLPWLWIAIALLLINLAVLAWVWSGRRNTPTVTASAPVVTPMAPATTDTPTVSRSREVRPLLDEAPGSTPGADGTFSNTSSATTDIAIPPPLSTFPELAARLPELHVHVHSYSPDPRQRFALINLKRYVEGERLTEGPLLIAIVPEGLVLEADGIRFLVPRG